MKNTILSRAGPQYLWKDQLHYFDSIGSTNDHLRFLARSGAPHGTAVIAGHQTGGHGRRGRSFHSPEGVGVYLSILLRPQCAPGELMHLTCATAVAMCDAVENACGFRPGIKWTNDLVYHGKKLAGILTELSLNSKSGLVEYAIIGVGINCCQTEADFPPDLPFAGSLAMFAPSDSCRVAAAMITALSEMDLKQKEAILQRYRNDCITLGKDISLVRGDTVRHGHAVDIDSEGALLVRFADGSTEAVSSGEVSIRGMYGYV
jgi:BirA family biotin operon repressor/biotin-[acetyl-CoA-carboxylase] ligase